MCLAVCEGHRHRLKRLGGGRVWSSSASHSHGTWRVQRCGSSVSACVGACVCVSDSMYMCMSLRGAVLCCLWLKPGRVHQAVCMGDWIVGVFWFYVDRYSGRCSVFSRLLSVCVRKLACVGYIDRSALGDRWLAGVWGSSVHMRDPTAPSSRWCPNPTIPP